MKNNKHFINRTILVSVFLLALVIALFWPMSKYIEAPGSADDLSSFVKISKHPDKNKGSFMITSVRISKARPITMALAKLKPDYYSIESEEAVTGGQTGKTYEKVQNFYMQSAINQAIATAYKAANKQVSRKYLGIYVLNISKNSNFRSKLSVGDTVTRVNKQHFSSAYGFQKYIRKQKVNQKMTISFTHNGHSQQATGKLIDIAKGTPGIGITLTDNIKVHTKIPIKVNPGDIGGPSGGLMFSLQIYSQLTGKNIRHGQKIAGTGTINPDGSVGEIGGIDKKIIAAHKAGAKIFFAPYLKPSKEVLKYEPNHLTNYEQAKKTAKKYAPGMKVVPVQTFKDALDYLEK